MNTETNKFDQWCIVELFGHQRIAGRVTEQSIGGCSFVRVDVPASSKEPEFTRLFGNGAIYAINPVSEVIARAAAANYQSAPVNSYDIAVFVQSESRRQKAISFDDIPFNEDDDREWQQ
jgi:hypothetical protein